MYAFCTEARTKLHVLIAVAIFMLLGGCVSSASKEKPHVLSGDAPTEEVIAKADDAFASGDMEAATILYQIALKGDPNADTWHKLGVTELRREHNDKAVYAFGEALRLDKTHVDALERLGLYHASKGESEKAREYLNATLEVAPENWRAYNALGVLSDRERDYDRAREHYTSALQIRPDLAMLWNNLGYSLYLMGELKLAQEYIDRALDLDPGYDPARMNLALLHVEREEYQQALGTFLSNESDAQAYTNVGYLAYQVGHLDRAEMLLEEGIRRSSTYNKPAHTYLAATRKALKANRAASR